MRDGILRKVRETAELERVFFEEHADRLAVCAQALARAFQSGRRLFAMGNGGSAADAQHVAVEFLHPIVEKRRALPALSLVSNPAVLTAVANDVDFARVFVDQLDVLAQPGDVVLALSSSGQSANVNRALAWAREHSLLTIGFAGRDGGAMAGLCEHSFVVPSWSIHRIQETHTMLLHLLWDYTHVSLGEDDVL